MELHPSQRRVSCELCRKNKAKCQRLQPDDPKCIRCTLNNVCCDVGQQRKVGRPKRKDPASLSSEGQNDNVPKRQRKSAKPASGSNVIVASRPDVNVSVRDPPGYLDGYGGPTQAYMHESDVSRCYPDIQSSVSTSDPGPEDTGWLGWPSFLTDRWCNKMLPSGRVLTDSESGSPPDAQPTYPAEFNMDIFPNGTQYDLVFPNAMDQAISQGSLAWINPNVRFTPDPIFNRGAIKRKEKMALPFGIGRPPAYYVHENMFSSDLRDSLSCDLVPDASNAMVRLLSIVYGLRLRSTLVQINKAKMHLGMLIHRRGPLFIGTYSLAEYVMNSAQEFEQLVSILLSRMDTPCRPDQQLSACILSTIVDVYCRLLSFFELFLEHMTDRAERFATDSVIPIAGLMFNGVVLTGACAQGTLFSSSIYHLLCRLENMLGLECASGTGLLSAEQLNELCDKLDRSNGLAQGRGIMRPADMRKLFAQVSTVLEQLSIHEP